MLWFVNSNRSIQKIVFTPSIHCYYLLSCFVISLEIKFDVFCVNSESGGVCVFRLAKIPSNAPLVFKNGWKIILMTGSCWEWYKVHFYTKTLNINIMLTFSTKRFDFAWNCIKKRIAWLYTIRVIVLDLNFRKNQRVCIVLDLNFWKKNKKSIHSLQVYIYALRPYAGWSSCDRREGEFVRKKIVLLISITNVLTNSLAHVQFN
jgi:hypothetical protein